MLLVTKLKAEMVKAAISGFCCLLLTMSVAASEINEVNSNAVCNAFYEFAVLSKNEIDKNGVNKEEAVDSLIFYMQNSPEFMELSEKQKEMYRSLIGVSYQYASDNSEVNEAEAKGYCESAINLSSKKITACVSSAEVYVSVLKMKQMGVDKESAYSYLIQNKVNLDYAKTVVFDVYDKQAKVSDIFGMLEKCKGGS